MDQKREKRKMKKKLVIIGANDFQNQLILKAKEKDSKHMHLRGEMER